MKCRVPNDREASENGREVSKNRAATDAFDSLHLTRTFSVEHLETIFSEFRG